ncbi:TPA: glycosyltransferase family 61 protein [Escherichia coli]|uniref:glycosyltransferase family 61 protein n=1 Tax=Escherichia coli TaxID=562 RepID=UPI000BE7A047|nr:glycosyltransferase family 61 protein [Escherichia coli]EFH2707715.1 DUF563 domain-containing protein [Escherichia coli]EFH2808367.1 DUF563 domain-containing protein [Escherichia coli]EFM6382194.1 glycosyltransferase family 61 protein [Escherichia coli]EIT2606360.1 glycosyltransferase family 61 protein [Escherichia coli]EIT2610872.1 glycosyltransferase family 61 protein [Escherichia coli]
MDKKHTDKLEACEYLQNVDIWLDNGNVDMFKVSDILNNLLKLGDFEKFDHTLSLLKAESFAEKIKFRLSRVESQRDSILHVIREGDKNKNLRKIILKSYDTKKTEIKSLFNIFSRESGLYFRNNHGNHYSYFEDDFLDYSNAVKNTLRDKGFAKKLLQHNQEKFRILDDAIVHTFNHNFYAISDKNGYYDSTNAARLAKLSHVNYINNDNEIRYIDKAIFLPIDHACNNYYHALSECFGGLKFITELPDDIPIVFTEDRFNVLDFIASRLCIDRKRFISIQTLANTRIKKALQLYPYSFNWSEDIFHFFKKISYPQTTDSKIYISRRKSSRGPLNEFEVENELKELGFDILYAEDLDFAQQVSIFSNASILIGPHGAGLTNILFMPKNSTLIEIFNSEYIQPDFYLRSRHNNMKYACAIQFNNTFNIEEIKEIIERCQE